MLEYYEVSELEKRWEEYDKKRKQFSFLKNSKSSNTSFKFDKTILALLLFISVAIGAIFWILKDSNDDKISMAQINQNSVEVQPETQIQSQGSQNSQVAIANQNENIVYTKSDFNMSAPIASNSSATSTERPTLNLNDVGIHSSEDSAGFSITNNYQNNNYPNNNYQNFPQPQFVPQQQNPIFNSVPQNEIIDFGNAPVSPRSNSVANTQTAPKRPTSPISSRIQISTSRLDPNKQNLESKFYATKNIEYSLALAEQAYNKKDYDGAIKWALTSNELNKDNVQSWMIFAKANYKKGRKNDALYALETFNSRANDKDIANLISQIRNGSL